SRDWSSDVCSSDLNDRAAPRGRLAFNQPLGAGRWLTAAGAYSRQLSNAVGHCQQVCHAVKGLAAKARVQPGDDDLMVAGQLGQPAHLELVPEMRLIDGKHISAVNLAWGPHWLGDNTLAASAEQDVVVPVDTQLMHENPGLPPLYPGLLDAPDQFCRFPAPHRPTYDVEAHWSPPPASVSTARNCASACWSLIMPCVNCNTTPTTVSRSASYCLRHRSASARAAASCSRIARSSCSFSRA